MNTECDHIWHEKIRYFIGQFHLEYKVYGQTLKGYSYKKWEIHSECEKCKENKVTEGKQFI